MSTLDSKSSTSNASTNHSSHFYSTHSSVCDEKQILFNLANCDCTFTGRKEELSQIETALNTNNNNSSNICKTIIISGPSGTGKSELARQIAWQYKNYHTAHVLWINAEISNTIKDLFKAAAEELGIPIQCNDNDGCGVHKERHLTEIIYDIYEHLNFRKTLVIFDNAVNRTSLEPFLLHDNYKNINVLVTSQENDDWTSYKRINLNCLTPSDACEFLHNNFREKSLHHADDVNTLAAELEYFPLVLQQAVAYINEKSQYGYTVAKYLKEYREKQLFLNRNLTYGKNNKPFPDSSSSSSCWCCCDDKTIFKSVSLTVKQISNEDKIALEILHVCSYLGSDNISKRFFEHITNNMNELDSAIYTLLKYSLLNVNNSRWGKIYNVHRLIQFHYRHLRNRKGYCKETLRHLLGLLNTYYWPDEASHYTSILRIISTIKTSDYSYFFKKCPNQEELVYYIGYNECNCIIKHTKNLFTKEHYLRAMQGAVEKGSLETVKLLYSLRKRKLLLAKHLLSDYERIVRTAVENNFVEIVKFFTSNGYSTETIVKYFSKHHHDNLVFTIGRINTSALHLAVQQKNLQLLKYLVHIDYNLNERDSDGDTALHLAARHGYVAIVRCLIESGNDKCNVNERNDDGETPVYVAYRYGHNEIVTYLIEHRCNLSLKYTNDGCTLLHVVTENGHKDLVDILVKQHIIINVQNNAGETAAHIAVRKKRPDILLTLIAHDCDLTVKNHHGFTPLHLAAALGIEEIVSILLNFYNNDDDDVNDSTDAKFTPLHLAVFGEYFQIAQCIFNKVINNKVNGYLAGEFNGLNATDQWYNIAKYLATCYPSSATVYVAAKLNWPRVISHLYETNANLDVFIDYGVVFGVNYTALHLAAKFGNSIVIQLLLDNKFNVNLPNGDGETPLHLAVLEGHKESVLVLVEHGCDINIKDHDGNTPLRIAIDTNQIDIVNILKNI